MTSNPFSTTITIPEDMRPRLRKPLGILVKGLPDQVKDRIRGILTEMRPAQVIAVGDVTASMLLDSGVKPNVMVVDDRVERRSYTHPSPEGYAVIKVSNRAGSIAPEAAYAIAGAIERGVNVVVLVDGEEDLLALPAIYFMPDGAVLLYGQPGEGCVIVRGGPDSRKMVEDIVDEASRRA